MCMNVFVRLRASVCGALARRPVAAKLTLTHFIRVAAALIYITRKQI